MEKIEKIIESLGAKLYDDVVLKESGNTIYRVYITAKDGVTLDLCAEITRMISPIIDLNPPVGGKYFLEVSSPGIERKLKRLNHFENAIGELVSITTMSKDKFKGKLVQASKESITIEFKDNTTKDIPYSDIKKAKTYFDFGK